jgi:hypothetical protein
LLAAEDFETEQKYHIEMRRLHNRLLHGFGIVEGLRVSADDNDESSVVVSPGFAVDGLGREIVVDEPVRIVVGACGKEPCFVTLQYAETATDPVPTVNGGSEFSRVTEGFSIGTASEDPCQFGTTQALGIARLIRQDGMWVIDENYRPSSLRRSSRLL